MTTDSLTETLLRTARAIASSIERVFDELQAVESELLAASAHMPDVPETTNFSFLQPLFEDLLIRNSPLIEGGGIAYEPGALKEADVVITMGCGDECPVFPGKRYEDWELADPAGKGIESVRPIRDEIRTRVEALVTELLPGRHADAQ